jgi:sodium-coupled monocarboxylate transporter 8/12
LSKFAPKTTSGIIDVSSFDPDVTRSDNFWAPVIGLSIVWISMTNTSQSCVQKLLSVATLRDAKLVIIYYVMGMSLVKTASVITGLIIYARYSDCDPFASHRITRKDQLLPYYVLDVAGSVPGLSGLFIAGVFSAGLSTLSAHLNCMSGTIYEDFVSKRVPRTITEQSKSKILKLIVVVCGVVCTALVFVFEHLGGILQLSISFAGATGGPLLGMFTLGTLSRRANCKGVFYGGVIGLIIVLSLALPVKYLQSYGIIRDLEKPTSIEGCSFNFTTVHQRYETQTPRSDESLVIFKISFYYYSLIGFFFTTVSGLIISYCTERDEKSVDETLLSPIIRQRVSDHKNGGVTEYDTVENALRLTIHNSEDKNDSKA